MNPVRIFKGLLVVFVALPFAALAAEIFIRVFDFDWKFVEKSVYYQTNNVQSHTPDPNPEIMYRLRPGYVMHVCPMTVNAVGARGPEISLNKPPGKFRIIAIGASNTLGPPPIEDDQTWPARLEALLNENELGKYEVVNLSAHAYVGVQMAVIGMEALQSLEPDLLIIAISNMGQRAFLKGAPVRPYFERNPQLYKELFPEEMITDSWLFSESSQLRLLENVRLYRFGLMMYTHYIRNNQLWQCNDMEKKNLKSFCDLIVAAKAKAGICFFVAPYLEPEMVKDYLAKLDAPIFTLRADDKPPIFSDAHPTAPVYDWYALKMAEWLKEKNLLAEQGT